jgi:MscS family membrane protein
MDQHIVQIIASAISILALPLLKYINRKIIRKYAFLSKKLESRTNQMIRIFAVLINLTLIIALIIIWGVDPQNLLVALSSIFAVIGVAMFAQWSILSNITSGILIFFTTPFRVGDYIRILDKDMDFDARVEEIMTFHTYLVKKNGERISYPNSLFFQKGISILIMDDWTDTELGDI